jgi:hypothetical protein
VVECLRQEGQLNSPLQNCPASALDLVTMVTDASEAIGYLRKHL